MAPVIFLAIVSTSYFFASITLYNKHHIFHVFHINSLVSGSIKCAEFKIVSGFFYYRDFLTSLRF